MFFIDENSFLITKLSVFANDSFLSIPHELCGFANPVAVYNCNLPYANPR